MERVLRLYDSFEDASQADLEEWLALDGNERLAIGEQLREEAFDGGSSGLQRVLRFVEREERELHDHRRRSL